MAAAPIIVSLRTREAAVAWGISTEPPLLYAAGSEIYAQGDCADRLYRLAFGTVRLYRLLSDGRRHISAFYLPGEIFGFEIGDEHQFFADAVSAAGVHALPPARVGGDPAIASAALTGLVRTQEHLMVVARQNACERVAAFLLDMAERQGDLGRLDLPMSRADIGDYLGLTIETVSRIISKLRAQGIIKLVSLRCLQIVKPAALKAMAS